MCLQEPICRLQSGRKLDSAASSFRPSNGEKQHRAASHSKQKAPCRIRSVVQRLAEKTLKHIFKGVVSA